MIIASSRTTAIGFLLFAASLLALPSDADARRRRQRGPSPSALVAKVRKAKNPKQRAKAVTRMLGALHVQVRTPKGRALTRGSVVGRSVYLYDFSARALGEAWKRGERVPLSEVAGRLELAGFSRRGRSLSAQRLAKAIRTGVRAGVKRRSLAMRVFQQLGRGHRAKIDARKLRAGGSLDPIQAQLLYVSWAQTVYGEVARRRGARASGPLAQASLKPICKYTGEPRDRVSTALDTVQSAGQDGLVGWGFKKLWGVLEGGRLRKAIIGEAADGVLDKVNKIRDIPLDGIHGAILAFSIRTVAPERVDPVHWNHDESERNVLEIPVRVVMLDDLPERIDCGPLAGMKFPRKGPVPNVPVTWNSAKLENHGQVICEERCSKDPIGYTIKTGPDGTATLRLRLNTEPMPAVGEELEETDVTRALVRFQEPFGSDPDKISYWMQYIAYKDGVNLGMTRWWVRYHKEPQLTLRFSVRDDHKDSDASGELVWTYDSTYWVTGEVPLTRQPDGFYSGSGEIAYQQFTRNDYKEYRCIDDPQEDKIGYRYRNAGAQPGTIAIDRLSVNRPATRTPLIDLAFHVPRLPVESTSQAVEVNYSDCPGASGVDQFEVFRNRVRNGFNWQPGPAYDGGEGVIAFREHNASGAFSHAERWELVASRRP